MKRWICFLICLISGNVLLAQAGPTIQGQVTDCETKEALAFAIVVGDDGKTGVMTDIDGNYSIRLPLNAKSIEVRYIGFVTEIFELGKVKNGETFTLNVCLKNLQTPDDSWKPEITIEGLRTNKPLVSIPSSIGLVGPEQLRSGDQTSLQNAVNTIPGVIMEQRGYGGSHRINIRGSAFRSPFAVRNIKMYMDGIPLTSPDGQTPLEMVDISEIESIEIIKGPAGSIWGSGNGGVLHMRSSREYVLMKRLSSSVEMGSYDLWRIVNRYEWGDRRNGISVSHVYQDNPGYRQQEYNRKNQVAIHGTYRPDANHKLLFYGTYFDGKWALPGGLNAVQADTLPTQASAYSWQNNANVARDRFMLGVSHAWQLDKRTSTRTAAYGYLTNKTNPFGTSPFSNGYKVEGANGAGIRTDWNKFIPLNKWNADDYLQFAWGGEYQFERYNILESTLLNGQAKDFRYQYDVDYHAAMAFFSADLTWHEKFFVNSGFSVNRVLQIVEGNTASDFRYDTTATWNWALLPRLAINWQFKKDWFAFISSSAGNANPTVFEMVDYENNSYNLGLKPESGLILEAGIKTQHAEKRWNAELNAYRFHLTNAIVSYQDTSSGTANEIFRYTNAGKTIQQGIEWTFSKTLLWFKEGSGLLLSAALFHSGSVYHYKFEDFSVQDGQYDGEQFSGNRLPGVPLMTISNLAVIRLLDHWQLNVQHQWFDKVPLNNSNEHWAGAYHLLNARVSYNTRFFEKLDVSVFAGVNNATNTRYTSFFNLNNEFYRFYNPSPPANYFGGLSLSWIFADRRVIILPD